MASNAASSAAKTSPKAATGAGTVDEATAIAQFQRLKKLVMTEALAIAGLSFLLAIILPLAQPIYLYYAMTPDKKLMQMAALDMPNMTNQAVLSWTTNSITEIMTMGFGDIDAKVPKQRKRFTTQGWETYTKAFDRMKIGESFKKNQLVLTTVPSNTPVVIGQGVNPNNIYQWNVQMPIIMTFATNNNVTKQQRAIVNLQIIRVESEDSPNGIAIQNWDLE